MVKKFIYYSRISIKEGLDISSKSLWTYDKVKSQKRSSCSQLFIISKKFNNDHKICNECHKVVSTTEIDGKMCIFWKNNAKYCIYSNLWQSFIDSKLRKEEDLHKFGNVDINKYDHRFDAQKEFNCGVEQHPLHHVNEGQQHRTHAAYNSQLFEFFEIKENP